MYELEYESLVHHGARHTLCHVDPLPLTEVAMLTATVLLHCTQRPHAWREGRGGEERGWEGRREEKRREEGRKGEEGEGRKEKGGEGRERRRKGEKEGGRRKGERWNGCLTQLIAMAHM